MSFIVSVNNLSKVFCDSELSALNSVSLDIKKKEFFGIVGRSGSGKSTLLRCIAGLVEPSSGRIESCYVKVGIIFQNFALLSYRDVLGNVMLPMELQNLSKNQARDRAFECLEQVGLSGKEGFYPKQLSGGQKQRVAIARAIAYDADLLLCDECTSSLDPQSSRGILDLLSELNKTRGITVVMVTHSVLDARKVCSRIALIADGSLVVCGEAEEVLSKYETSLSREDGL